MKAQDWLEAHAIPIPETGCWIYEGFVNPNGYATTRLRGQAMTIGRAVYRRFYGEIPAGLFVCHRCDVPLCVSPHHLFLGTPRDNTQDSIAKGRSPQFAKQTHCSHGHPLVAVTWSEYLVCPVCRNANQRRRWAKKHPQRYARRPRPGDVTVTYPPIEEVMGEWPSGQHTDGWVG